MVLQVAFPLCPSTSFQGASLLKVFCFLHVTVSSANVGVHEDCCLTSFVSLSITTANKKRGQVQLSRLSHLHLDLPISPAPQLTTVTLIPSIAHSAADSCTFLSSHCVSQWATVDLFEHLWISPIQPLHLKWTLLSDDQAEQDETTSSVTPT